MMGARDIRSKVILPQEAASPVPQPLAAGDHAAEIERLTRLLQEQRRSYRTRSDATRAAAAAAEAAAGAATAAAASEAAGANQARPPSARARGQPEGAQPQEKPQLRAPASAPPRPGSGGSGGNASTSAGSRASTASSGAREGAPPPASRQQAPEPQPQPQPQLLARMHGQELLRPQLPAQPPQGQQRPPLAGGAAAPAGTLPTLPLARAAACAATLRGRPQTSRPIDILAECEEVQAAPGAAAAPSSQGHPVLATGFRTLGL